MGELKCGSGWEGKGKGSKGMRLVKEMEDRLERQKRGLKCTEGIEN